VNKIEMVGSNGEGDETSSEQDIYWSDSNLMNAQGMLCVREVDMWWWWWWW